LISEIINFIDSNDINWLKYLFGGPHFRSVCCCGWSSIWQNV